MAQEIAIICEQLSIEDCNETRLSKSEYRQIFTAACHIKNEAIIRNEASEKKCWRIKEEEYGMKEYVRSQTIPETRKWF